MGHTGRAQGKQGKESGVSTSPPPSPSSTLLFHQRCRNVLPLESQSFHFAHERIASYSHLPVNARFSAAFYKQLPSPENLQVSSGSSNAKLLRPFMTYPRSSSHFPLHTTAPDSKRALTTASISYLRNTQTQKRYIRPISVLGRSFSYTSSGLPCFLKIPVMLLKSHEP